MLLYLINKFFLIAVSAPDIPAVNPNGIKAFLPNGLSTSLLNYVPYVLACLTCPTCLVPYRLLCLTCLMPYVVSCPTFLVPHVRRALPASCLKCLVLYVPRVILALVSDVS